MPAEHDRRIDYVEFPGTDLPATRRFYESAFGWKFQDYGPDYTSFNDGRLSGGFDASKKPAAGGPLVVLYASSLRSALAKVVAGGGRISRETFAFPGGSRFHFQDPSGNELAVWSETDS